MARRLTCTEDGSSKFWEGGVEGTTLTVRFGKLGTSGQVKVKTFSTAADAEKELAKLVKEKLGKGYLDEGGSPPASPGGGGGNEPALGKYTTALIAMLQEQKKRDVPEAHVTAWLEKETRPRLRALFTALAAHRLGGISVGDFWFNTQTSDAMGTHTCPRRDDPSKERDDVIVIGSTGGGDPFVTRAPGTSDDESIWMILHDEGWSDGERWISLEDFLEDRVIAYRESEEEQGTPKRDIHLDIEDYLDPKKRAAAGTETPIAGGGLTLVADPGPPLESRDTAEKTFRDFFYATRTQGGDWEQFWHGTLAFAAVPFAVESCDGPAYRAAFFDRGGERPEVHLVEPRVVRWQTHDADYDSTMLRAWRHDGSRVLVAGASAVELDFAKNGQDVLRERGRGTIVEADPATGAAKVVCEGPPEVVAGLSPDPLLAIGWVGEMVGTILKGKKGNTLELRARDGDGWKVVRSVACGKSDVLLSAGGRLAIVTKKKGAKASSFLLGVRGTEVRLLGSLGEIVADAFTTSDGRPLLAFIQGSKRRWSEVRRVEEALDAAFSGPAPELVLK